MLTTQADPGRNPKRFYLPEFLTTLWNRAVEKAGLEPINLKNGTRHSRGFELRRQGVDINVIARLFGHSDAKTTRRNYVDDDAELVREKLPTGCQRLPKIAKLLD